MENAERALAPSRRGTPSRASRVLTECLEPRRLFAGTLTGRVFNDLNGDGYREYNEPGLANYQVNGSGGLVSITDATGTFRFPDAFIGGRFSVAPATRPDFINTGSSSSTFIGRSTDEDIGDAFSLTQKSVIVGGVLTNAAGTPGLPGQLVYIDGNRNARRDPGEPFTVTDGGGSYQLGGLSAGTYQVRLDPSSDLGAITQPAGSVTFGLAAAKYSSNYLRVDTPPGPAISVSQREGDFAVNVSHTFVAEGDTLELDTGNSTGAVGTYQWDGDYVPGAAFTADVTGDTYSFTAGPTRDGNATVFLATRMLDPNGVAGPVHVTIVDIINTPPTGTFAGTTTQAGQPAGVSFTGVSDPSAADAASLGFSYDLDNDGVFEIVGSSSSTAALPAKMTATPGVYTVRGRITDKDGGYSDYSTSVTVNPPPSGFIRSVLFNDANWDGVQQADEAALSDRTVFLDTDNDNVIDADELTTTTDLNGVANFTVSPGSYNVRQVLPAGWRFTNNLATTVAVTSDTTTNVALGSQVVTAYDSGMSGTIFQDANGNGTQDTGEASLGGRTVFDDRNNNGFADTGERSAVSNSDGFYFIGTYEPGAHTVRQVLPSGWEQTSPSTGMGYAVDVSASVSVSNRNFGSRSTPVTPTDPALAKLEAEGATLSGGTTKGTSNAGYTGTGYADFGGSGSAVQWTTTRNAAGQVSLEFRYANGAATDRPLTITVNGVNLGTLAFPPTGSWATWKTVSIKANLIAGTNIIKAVAGSATGANVDSLTIRTAVTPPPPPPATGSISGFTFDDTDKDGVYDATETKTSGRTVFIDLDGDSVLDSNEQRTTTGANGAWSFSALPAGNYAVRQVFASGTTISTPLLNVALATGQAAAGLAIGQKPVVVTPPASGTASVSGSAFNDNNANGKYDAGDGIGKGVTVFLDLDGDNVLDANERSVVTDSGGKFTFGALAAGNYHVRRVFAAGYVASPTPPNVAVTAGQAKTGLILGAKRA